MFKFKDKGEEKTLPSFRVSVDVHKKVKSLAIDNKTTISEILRQMIDYVLQEREKNEASKIRSDAKE